MKETKTIKEEKTRTREELRIEIASRMAGADIELASAIYEDLKEKGNNFTKHQDELWEKREWESLPWYKKLLTPKKYD